MRIIYPEDIKTELETIAPYVEFKKEEGCVNLKVGTPEDIRKRYGIVKAKIEKLRSRVF